MEQGRQWPGKLRKYCQARQVTLGQTASVPSPLRCACVRNLESRHHVAPAVWLYRDWLPQSGEDLRDFPIFFHYVNVGPDVKEQEMVTDVYLPLK